MKAVPYPARRPLQVQECLELPSDSSLFDSPSKSFHAVGGGMPGGDGGGGGGGGRSSGGGPSGGKNAKDSWTKSLAGQALSAPLLPQSDSDRGRSHGDVSDDGMGSDSKPSISASLSDSSSNESQGSRDVPTRRLAGVIGRRNLRKRLGNMHRVSTVSKRRSVRFRM